MGKPAGSAVNTIAACIGDCGNGLNIMGKTKNGVLNAKALADRAPEFCHGKFLSQIDR